MMATSTPPSPMRGGQATCDMTKFPTLTAEELDAWTSRLDSLAAPAELGALDGPANLAPFALCSLSPFGDDGDAEEDAPSAALAPPWDERALPSTSLAGMDTHVRRHVCELETRQAAGTLTVRDISRSTQALYDLGTAVAEGQARVQGMHKNLKRMRAKDRKGMRLELLYDALAASFTHLARLRGREGDAADQSVAFSEATAAATAAPALLPTEPPFKVARVNPATGPDVDMSRARITHETWQACALRCMVTSLEFHQGDLDAAGIALPGPCVHDTVFATFRCVGRRCMRANDAGVPIEDVVYNGFHDGTITGVVVADKSPLAPVEFAVVHVLNNLFTHNKQNERWLRNAINSKQFTPHGIPDALVFDSVVTVSVWLPCAAVPVLHSQAGAARCMPVPFPLRERTNAK